MNKFDKILEDIPRLNALDTKTIPEKVLKFNEEFGEFSQELIKLLGFTHKPYDEEHFIEESADSLQVLLSIQLAACKLKGISYSKVLDALLVKNKKWEAKSKEYTRDIIDTNNGIDTEFDEEFEPYIYKHEDDL